MFNKKTYNDLIQDVKFYLNRTDQDTLSRIPIWVHVAQEQLDRIMRHPATEVSIEYKMQPGDMSVPVPANMLEMKHLRNADTGDVLYRWSLEILNHYSDDPYPTGYCRRGAEYLLNKRVEIPFTLEMICYMAPSRLEKADDVNMYTVQCYDMLLYYAVAEGFAYLHDMQVSQYFQQKAEASYNMIMESIDREKRSGSGRVVVAEQEKNSKYF